MSTLTRIKSRNRLIAAIESVEPRRFLSTVAGTIFADANRNGFFDAGELPLAGRTIFADYDYNGVVNGDEPIATTDSAGNYSLSTRASNVSVRVVTHPGESISLPYGANSLWFASVSGTVTGKNIGIATTSSPTTTIITGFGYLDENSNGQFDVNADQVIPPYFDLNDNGVFDATVDVQAEYQAGNMTFIIRNVPIGVRHAIRFARNVTGGLVVADPPNFTPRYLTTAALPNDAGTFRLTRLGTAANVYLFADSNGNSLPDQNEPEVYADDVWVDINRDGIRQADEPLSENGFILPTATSPGRTNGEKIMLPPGTWRVAYSGRNVAGNVFSGFREVIANSGTPRVDILVNTLSNSSIPTVAGTVFADTNRNGILDTIESRLSGRTVFADYNYNGRKDDGEPFALTDSNGLYSLSTRSSNVSVQIVLNASELISLPYGASSLWFASVNGTVTGKNIGIATAAPATGLARFRSFLDTNSNRQRDTGEPNVRLFALWDDVNGNGTVDPGEPSAEVSGAVPLDGYELSLPFGRHNVKFTYAWFWRRNVAGGIQFDLSADSPLFSDDLRFDGDENSVVPSGFVAVDLNGNGRVDESERSAGVAGQTVFADYNYNGLHDTGEPLSVTDAAGKYFFTATQTQFAIVLQATSGYRQIGPLNNQPQYFNIAHDFLTTNKNFAVGLIA